MSAQADINSPASGGGETLEEITGIRPGLWGRAVPPYVEPSPEENLRWLERLDEARVKVIRYYTEHPEELETADQGVRRLFFFDRAKYGDWPDAVDPISA